MSHRALPVVFLTLAFAFSTSLLFAQQAPDGPSSSMGPTGTPNAASPNAIGSINGNLSAIDGKPISDARIELRDTMTGNSLASVFTKANGSFQLYNITPGAYEVVATSGLNEARERVQVLPGMAFVNLQINAPGSDPSAGPAVSVASMKVPGKASKEFDKAQKAFTESKLDQAKDHVNKALAIYPNYAQALTLRGILFINDNKNDEGQADLQNAIKFDSTYALAYFAMGAALNQAGKYDDALRTLQRGIVYSPDSWQGYFEIAKASLGKGNFDAALKNVNRASQMVKDDYPPLHLVKAHALLGLKQYDTAISELEGYLFREPNGAAADSARKTLDQAKAFVASGAVSAKTTAGAQ